MALINEDAIIDLKKKEYLRLGIKLSRYRYVYRSIMTMSGKLTFKRMALSPYKKNEKELLEQLTGNRMVFPLDEVLQISNLPYKLTIDVMLEIAYWVQQSSSYEVALHAIKHNTSIDVNEETIRSVANTIGALVFDRDTREANRVREQYDQGKLIFPDVAQKNHELYLEVDGAMLHTRDIENNSSPWRENKLGHFQLII
jgi:hypothetical protein